MKSFLMLTIYMDEREIKIVSSKRTEAGFYMECEPYKVVPIEEWDELAENIAKMMNINAENPITGMVNNQIFEKVSGIKNYKTFSKKHLCICVKLYEDEEYEVHNECRLSDGSYGEQSGVTEEYNHKYICKKDDLNALQENLTIAYQEGKTYQESIRRKK